MNAVKTTCAIVVCICAMVSVGVCYYKIYELFRVGEWEHGALAGALLTAFIALSVLVVSHIQIAAQKPEEPKA